MKTRIFTVILCAIMLVCTIFACSSCTANNCASLKYSEAKAYVFFPNGKLQVYGDCDDAKYMNNGVVAVEIEGHVYFAPVELVNIDAIME